METQSPSERCGRDGCMYWRERTLTGLLAPCPRHDGYVCHCTYRDGRAKPSCKRCHGSGRVFPHPQMIGFTYVGPMGGR